MHPFFKPLNQNETMLLLTSLTIGGSNAKELFDFLPPEQSQKLHDKATKLLSVPAKNRIAFMVKEIKEALAQEPIVGIDVLHHAGWCMNYSEKARELLLLSSQPFQNPA